MTSNYRLFISQPMFGVSEDDILETRYQALKFFKSLNITNKPIVVISKLKMDMNLSNKNKKTDYLGNSIKLLGTADGVIFASNWDNYDECLIQFDVAKRYNIQDVYFE